MSGQAFTRQRERTAAPSGPLAQSLMRPKSTHRFWRECPAAAASCAVIALLTFICYRFHINNATVVPAFLLAVIVSSRARRLVASLVVAVGAAGFLDFFFCRRRFRFE